MKSPITTASDTLKKASIPSTGTLFMIVALCVLGGIGWFMISAKEEYLVQRNFRLLKLWSQDISSKIEGYQQVVEFSAKGILDRLHFKTQLKEENDYEKRNRFLRTYSPPSISTEKDMNHKALLEEISPWACSQKLGATHTSLKNTQLEIIRDLERQLVEMCKAEGLRTITLSIPDATDTGNTERFKLAVSHSQNAPVVQLTYFKTVKSNHGNESDHENESIQIIGEIDLESFLTRLFKEPIFDEVLLFDSTPDTTSNEKNNYPLIFDSGSQEFPWTNFQTIIEKSTQSESFLSSLLSNPQDISKLHKQLSDHNSPNQFLINLPGKTNNVFTLPVIVSRTGNVDWRLVGMIDHDAFQNSYLAISSSLVLGVMFLILGLLLSIPFLHLKTMGAKDPLRMSHVLTVIFAAFLGTGTFTFLVLDLAIYDEGTDTLRNSMESSAKNMKAKVHDELWSILSTLTYFDQSQFLKNDKEKLNIDQKSETVEKIGERSVFLEVFEQENLQTLPNRQCNALSIRERQQCHPDFLSAFWMDQDGSLRINWAKTLTRGVSSNISLRGRDYVKNILDEPDNLWEFSHKFGQDESNAKNFRFFLEPIISWTTGGNTVVASMPSQNDQHTPNGWVAAIEFRFASLMDQVVLPPGIGFAVIENDTHRVLFHSKEGRNLREAFLVETDHNQQLRDLFATRTDGHVNGSYWGKSRSFYTLPLEPLPWALVVYRDREILQSVNLFGLVIAGGVYSLWSFIVYLIVWALFRRISKHRKAVCLWPNATDHLQYVNLIKSNFVIFVVGLFSLWKLSGQPGLQLVTALLIIPGISVVGAVILVKFFPQKGEASLPSLRNSYVYLATSFLLVFAVIPAFGCFSSVFHKEMTLLTQYQLLETFKKFQSSGKQTIIASSQFLENDFLDPRSLIDKFREHEDSISKYIHSKFSETTKELLKGYSDDKDASSSQIKLLTAELTKELNNLLSPKPSLTQPYNNFIRYQNSDLENMKYEWVKPISRLLLEDVFPEEIRRPTRTFQSITLHPGCETSKREGNDSYGFYANFFFTSTWSNCPKTDSYVTAKPEYFDQFFALASQPFLPLLKNLPLWGFLGKTFHKGMKSNDKENKENQASSKDSINWMTGQQGLTGYFRDSQTMVSARLPLQPWFLSGKEPALSFLTLGKTIKYFLITGLFMVLLITIPKFIATRTVFLNYPTPFKVPQDLLFAQANNGSSRSNQLILGFPGQGKTPKASPLDRVKKPQNEGEKEKSAVETYMADESDNEQKKKLPPIPLYFDLKAIPPEQWKNVLSNKISKLKLTDNQDLHVTVDHLERQWKDPAINLKKLELMEWLLHRSYDKRNLVVKVLSEPIFQKKS